MSTELRKFNIMKGNNSLKCDILWDLGIYEMKYEELSTLIY